MHACNDLGFRSYLFACGSNQYGQLGSGGLDDSYTLQPVPPPEAQSSGRVLALAAGGGHTLALYSSEDGSEGSANDTTVLLACGWGSHGQTGNGAFSECNPSLKPVLLPASVRSVARVACGFSHSACTCTHSGALLTWGCNRHGQLGLGDTENRNIPTEVQVAHVAMNVVSFDCGLRHMCVVVIDGTALAFGCNAGGQCGAPYIRAKAAAHGIKVKSHGMSLQPSESLSTNPGPVNRFFTKPVVISIPLGGGCSNKTQFTDAACGNRHTALLSADGRVCLCGENKWGQCGAPTNLHQVPPTWLPLERLSPQLIIHSVHCGAFSTSLVVQHGRQSQPSSGLFELWNCGRGDFGQLGRQARDHTSEGLLQQVLDVNLHQPTGSSSPYIYSCGPEHSILLGRCCRAETCISATQSTEEQGTVVQGQLYGFGWNEHGQLGTGDISNVLFPEPIPGCTGQVCAVASGGGHTWVATVVRSSVTEDANE